MVCINCIFFEWCIIIHILHSLLSLSGFRVHTDGYLYFNIWKSYDGYYFDDDVDTHIANGEERWIKWFGSLQAGPFNHYCFSTNGHETIYDCVDYAQRYAPAVNTEEEIYPTDDYIDPWFNQFTTTVVPNGSTTSIIETTETTQIKPNQTSSTTANTTGLVKPICFLRFSV